MQKQNHQQPWKLPPLPLSLPQAINELRALARGGLDQQKQEQQEQIKGLKFIANKLSRLFDRTRKLNYAHVSKILIQNFSSENNDSRNIKRRVYDAINVMVSAGIFRKTGQMLQKNQNQEYRDKVQYIKNQLNNQYSQKQKIFHYKKTVLTKITARQQKLKALVKKNQGQKGSQKKIENAVFVSVDDSVRTVHVQANQKVFCDIQIKRQKGRKNQTNNLILDKGQYLDYL